MAKTTTAEVEPVTLRSGAADVQLGWDFGGEFTLPPGVRGKWHKRFGGVVAQRVAVACTIGS